MVNWKSVRAFLFPAECLLFLYMSSVMFQMFFAQQYYFQMFFRKKLSSLPNCTSSVEDICLTQEYIVNFTGNSSFLHTQKEINHLNMYSNIVSIGMSFLSSMMLGSLSDALGRRPVAALSLIGMLATTIFQTLIVRFQLSPYLFLAALALHGFTGGFPLIIGMCYASVADTTSRRWLGIRMSFLEGTIGFGRAAAYLATNNWINSTNCQFFYPSFMNIAITVLSLIYLFLMPETAPYCTRNESKPGLYEERSKPVSIKQYFKCSELKELFNGLKIYFYPPYIGYAKWWRVVLATAVICLCCGCTVGSTEVLNFYLHNKPLEWSYEKIGYYGAASSTFLGLALITVFPLLVVIKLSYPLIALVGVIAGVAGNAIIALIKTDTEMYIAGVLINIIFMFPAMRALLERYAFKIDRGALFSVCASFQMLFSVFASITFNEVYQPEADVNGHLVDPSTVFWIMLGIFVTCVPMLLVLQFIKLNDTPPSSLTSLSVGEKKPLLQNEYSSSVTSPSHNGTVN